MQSWNGPLSLYLVITITITMEAGTSIKEDDCYRTSFIDLKSDEDLYIPSKRRWGEYFPFTTST